MSASRNRQLTLAAYPTHTGLLWFLTDDQFILAVLIVLIECSGIGDMLVVGKIVQRGRGWKFH
jgi:hypothetical protein